MRKSLSVFIFLMQFSFFSQKPFIRSYHKQNHFETNVSKGEKRVSVFVGLYPFGLCSWARLERPCGVYLGYRLKPRGAYLGYRLPLYTSTETLFVSIQNRDGRENENTFGFSFPTLSPFVSGKTISTQNCNNSVIESKSFSVFPKNRCSKQLESRKKGQLKKTTKTISASREVLRQFRKRRISNETKQKSSSRFSSFKSNTEAWKKGTNSFFPQIHSISGSKRFRKPKRSFLFRTKKGYIRRQKNSFLSSRRDSKSKLNKPSKAKKVTQRNGKKSLLARTLSSSTELETSSRFQSNWTSGLASNGSISVQNVTRVLSLLAGVPVHLTRRNALSLSRFAFDFESLQRIHTSHRKRNPQGKPEKRLESRQSNRQKKTSLRFLRQLEQERSSRFQYVAVYIPDLVRITFLSRYLKKATFLASFLAFTLAKLPRNRKETQFLRFLRKVVKVFASQRKERLGVRIRFQGRVNRWRRTKHIVGEKGRIPFYTYTSRLEYGRAQAITRKGALGIRLWLCYRPSFSVEHRRTLLQFVSTFAC